MQGNGTEADKVDFQAMLEALKAKLLQGDGRPEAANPSGSVQTVSPSKSEIMLLEVNA